MIETDKPMPANRAQVGLGEALRFWARLGLVSFGGPAGQIALMHQELVERRGWIGERQFLHALNFCMLLPGPEAQQLATYSGWLLHRTLGGLLAGALFVLPSLVLLIGLSWLYLALGDLWPVAGLFYGIKPAVTAIVFQAAWRIGTRVLKAAWALAIALAAFLAIFVFAVPFPWIVLAAALIGLVGGRWAPARFGVESMDEAARVEAPGPGRRLLWRGALRVLALGALAWLVPMGLLLAAFGPTGTYPEMAWFFTKAALLTFGGAYAVLPYVYQGAVLEHGWLGPRQMIDGLALGETTPGPLIMVVAFVAFVGGYTALPLGEGREVLSGVLAALLVTWFTFLPSFVFVLLGAPLVESTRGSAWLQAPLSAITAAVVGVIANLALFFAFHTFWPEGFAGSFEWPAALIALAAGFALLRLKWNVLPVLGGCALAGLLWFALGR